MPTTSSRRPSRALEALGRFRWQGAGSFERWLASIAEHVILEAARKDEKRPRLALDPETPGSGASPSEELRREERFERLEKALDRLSPAEREAVLLSRIERLKVDEIARRLDRSPDAVKQLLSRGLRKLKESFGDTESLSLPDRAFGGRPNGGGGVRGERRGSGAPGEA
ncbi:MAG: sigma-70 family RNA polymerase sigma factor [Planctomycetes bacterium]|nr:sigma-70 family RNA polymerase sigma factor [Planctomycetota bacterium]